MASPSLHHSQFIFILISSLLSCSLAQQSFRPKALVLPVTKDASTRQYVTRIHQRTPLVPLSLVVDLGGLHFWVACDKSSYVSSTFSPARCGSAQCSLGTRSYCGGCNAPPAPGCNNNTCVLNGEDTVARVDFLGDLGSDVLSLPSTDGSTPGRMVSVPKFIFVCGYNIYLEGLASGVQGMAGLGRTKIGFPSQLSSAFGFRRKFAICLSSSTTSSGVIFFGDGPYNILPNVDYSQALIYTPLLSNPRSTARVAYEGEPSYEYFIGVKSITVGTQIVSFNSSLLTFNKYGVGGTKISTVNPYTVLRTPIFDAVTKAFISEAAFLNITRVPAVRPFGVCFSSKNIVSTARGPLVPTIFLTLQNADAVWTILGSNSMVRVNDDVLCLGLVDGGDYAQTSIVIGGYQLEDMLLQFDLATSRVGFSNVLMKGRRPRCANFNFTSRT